MEYHDPAHPSVAVGADVDIAQALAKQMGLSGAKVVNGVFDTLITSLQAKRYDIVMSSMSDTPERAKKIDFVDYMTGTEGILVPTSSAIKGNTYAALCGKSVAVEKGTTELFGLQAADKSCSSKMNILSFPDDVGAYNAFAAGHADSYTSDLPVVLNYINKYKGKYRQAGKAIFSGGNYGIALRKGDTALKKAIQSALSKIRSNGTYTKILKKWGVADAALKA
jgi:polar amino acid transport system substrate-binding protein